MLAAYDALGKMLRAVTRWQRAAHFAWPRWHVSHRWTSVGSHREGASKSLPRDTFGPLHIEQPHNQFLSSVGMLRTLLSGRAAPGQYPPLPEPRCGGSQSKSGQRLGSRYHIIQLENFRMSIFTWPAPTLGGLRSRGGSGVPLATGRDFSPKLRAFMACCSTARVSSERPSMADESMLATNQPFPRKSTRGQAAVASSATSRAPICQVPEKQM